MTSKRKRQITDTLRRTQATDAREAFETLGADFQNGTHPSAYSRKAHEYDALLAKVLARETKALFKIRAELFPQVENDQISEVAHPSVRAIWVTMEALSECAELCTTASPQTLFTSLEQWARLLNASRLLLLGYAPC